MAIALKQSTASQEVVLGPFLDSTDGVTAKTGLTIANTDIQIWVNGATTLASKNSGGATHISSGIYFCVLDATDTATVGPMMLFVSVANALPIKQECVVMPALLYDSLVAGTDQLQIDAVQLAGQTITAAAGVTFPASVASPTNITAGTITTVSGNVTGSVGSVASGIPSAATVAAAVWDEATASHVSAGSVGLALRDADLRGSRTVIRGAVSGTAPSTTSFTPSALSPAGVAADQFKGRIIIFDNDTATTSLRGQATDITANTAAGLPVFTFTALTTAPSSGDTFSIV
jgi:hypothetical protein